MRLLRSASLARAVLVYLALFGAIGAWLPWARAGGGPPPAWAVAAGLARPFASAWLLAGVAVLFVNTLACTWGKRARTARLLSGELPAAARILAGAPGAPSSFLRARGWRGDGPVLRRNGWALWGGWVLHVGLLAMIAGIVVQQLLSDGGQFELAEREVARLSDPGVVFSRERGLLAPAEPPPLEVALVAFDPFRHQPGYAPDRLSVVRVRGDGAPRELELDRARGARIGGVEVFQAIPAGLALELEIAGLGRRIVRLRSEAAPRATAEVEDRAGRRVRLSVLAERGPDDPLGTGAVAVRVARDGGEREVAIGEPFDFGGVPARVADVARWSGFSYARSPGLPLVFGGFAVVLAGALLLVLPAGVARVEADGGAERARYHLRHGGEVLQEEWAAAGARGSERG